MNKRIDLSNNIIINKMNFLNQNLEKIYIRATLKHTGITYLAIDFKNLIGDGYCVLIQNQGTWEYWPIRRFDISIYTENKFINEIIEGLFERAIYRLTNETYEQYKNIIATLCVDITAFMVSNKILHVDISAYTPEDKKILNNVKSYKVNKNKCKCECCCYERRTV